MLNVRRLCVVVVVLSVPRKCVIGRIYTRRRLRRPEALNVRRLSASLSASRFYTRRLKRLRRLIHLLSTSIGRT